MCYVEAKKESDETKECFSFFVFVLCRTQRIDCVTISLSVHLYVYAYMCDFNNRFQRLRQNENYVCIIRAAVSQEGGSGNKISTRNCSFFDDYFVLLHLPQLDTYTYLFVFQCHANFTRPPTRHRTFDPVVGYEREGINTIS